MGCDQCNTINVWDSRDAPAERMSGYATSTDYIQSQANFDNYDFMIMHCKWKGWAHSARV